MTTKSSGISKLTLLLWGTEKEQQRRGIIYAGGILYINENMSTSGISEVVRFKKIVAHLSGVQIDSCQPCTVHELSDVVIFTFPFDGNDCYLAMDESRVVFIRPSY